MATAELPRSMNEANERDPYNNNCYGTLVDRPYVEVKLPVLDVHDFNERVIRGYEEGSGEKELPADLALARSLIPAGTAALRDFSYVAPEIPEYIRENCTGCMDCVTECPDTAILGKVIAEPDLEEKLAAIDNEDDRQAFRGPVVEDAEVLRRPARKRACRRAVRDHHRPVEVQGLRGVRHRVRRQRAQDDPQDRAGDGSIRKSHRLFKQVGPSDNRYINDNLLIDMMLKEQTHVYVGGAGSCAGCGEGTALRMMCAATGAKYGDQWGIVAATGCNTVYTSTYPYNPYLVPWTNSLFENAPADAMGVRARWDQMGWQDKPLWCIGGDGAFFDIGFQSLSRMFASGMPIKCFVLDTQVYSNTGGQASTSTLHRPEHEDEHPRQDDRRQAGAAEGDRSNRDDAPADVRGADDVCPHEPLLQGGARGAGVRWAGDRQPATRRASRSTAWPTTWRASRRGWRSTRGRFRC